MPRRPSGPNQGIFQLEAPVLTQQGTLSFPNPSIPDENLTSTSALANFEPPKKRKHKTNTQPKRNPWEDQLNTFNVITNTVSAEEGPLVLQDVSPADSELEELLPPISFPVPSSFPTQGTYSYLDLPEAHMHSDCDRPTSPSLLSPLNLAARLSPLTSDPFLAPLSPTIEIAKALLLLKDSCSRDATIQSPNSLIMEAGPSSLLENDFGPILDPQM